MAEEVNVIAKYDYAAAEDGELDLRKNEKLVVLDKTGSWWKVQNQLGRSGLVPSNFLKTYKPSIFSSLKKIIRKPSRGESDPSSGVLSQPRHVNGAAGGPDSQAMSEMTLCDMFTAVARYAYEAQKQDELSLVRGDTVVVREKSSDGWWRGRHATTGLYGWFPSNYVEIHSNDVENGTTASPNSTLDDSCRRRRTVSIAGPARRAVAIFKFDATNDDELSIEENERVDILDDSEITTDAGWLRARNARGDIGLIPQEFVRIISGGSSDSPQSGAAVNTASGGSLSNSSAGQGSLGAERSSSGISLSGTSSRNGSAPFAGRDWYFGNISRSECEELMNQFADNGDFLIRESETNVGDYTLTMKTPLRNKHFRIIADCSGTYRIGPQLFHSLDDLVEHYTRHAIYRLGAEKLFLVKPFAKADHLLGNGRASIDSLGGGLDSEDGLRHDNTYDM